MYAFQIHWWLQHFPPQQMLVIGSDQVTTKATGQC
jgi:hypothetical protein